MPLPYIARYDACPKCGGRVQYRPITCVNGSVQYRCECMQPPCRWWTNVPHTGNGDAAEQRKRAAWGRTVRERDGYRCQRCGSTENTEAHHIVPYAGNLALRYDPSNGITLCRKCHDAEHPWRVGKDWRKSS